MRIGILGDLQLTDKAPQRRVDDYFQTQLEKVNQALTIFEENGCNTILQPGDFFDAPIVANRVKASIITLLKEYSKKVYCTFGQHDIVGHSKTTLSNSPLMVLQAAEVVEIIDLYNKCIMFDEEKNWSFDPLVIGTIDENSDISVCLYGAGFGEEVPEPNEDGYNILVTHQMIGDRPLWPGQELLGPRAFLRKHPGYDLVVCGDYHYRFVEEWSGRTIVNVGALVRKTIGEFDLEHKPAVGVFDTSNNSLKIFELSVKPIEEIFNFTKDVKKRDSKDNIVLAKLVERLKKGGDRLSGWKHVLLEEMERRKTNEEVKGIINKTLEEVKGKK